MRAPLTAFFKFASSNIIRGDFPPNSRVTFFIPGVIDYTDYSDYIDYTDYSDYRVYADFTDYVD